MAATTIKTNHQENQPGIFTRNLKGYEVPAYLLIWLLLNLVTAVCTELYSDEAYYWVFSRFLNWGYLDHPPMIAALIKLGTVGGSTELGVRIIPVLMGTATLWLIYKLCQPMPARLFFVTVFSMLSLNLIGFLSVPDVPLLFFATLFFYSYREYLKKPSGWTAILLGVTIAALLYSKYHGILLVAFTLMSHPQLFRQRTLYLAAATAIILLLPHIIWQIQHDYPSLQYHLVDRGSATYQLKQTLAYLLGNIPFHGPWVSIVLVVAALRYHTKDLWEKALKWNLVGIFIFFLFMTSKGSVEANWTLIMVIPFLILGLKKLMEWSKFQKTYLRICYVFVVAVLIVRFLLLFPLESIPIKRVLEFHGSKKYVASVFERASGLPVVANSYQDASLLSFYAPGQTYIVPALNIDGRSNQYDFWDLDLPLCGEKVLYANNHLTGVKIPGRKQTEKTLTTIAHLPQVSGWDLEIIKVKKEPSILVLETRVSLLAMGCNEDALDNIFIKVDLWKDDQLIKEHYVEFDETLNWASETNLIPIELSLDPQDEIPNSVSLSFYFKELGGSTRIVPRQDL